MLRGKSGLSSAAVLLVILALTGKLAFLTLSKKQLQSTNAAVSLLQVGQSAPLDHELAHLIKERALLANKYARVTAVQNERAQIAREKKALLAKEHHELAALKHVKQEISQQQVHVAKKATRLDEKKVKQMVHREFELEAIAAKRARATAQHAAVERKYEEAMARRHLEQEEIETEERAEAKKELVAERLIPGTKKTAKAAHAELLLHEKNLKLEETDKRLATEARHMQVALQWAPKRTGHAAVGVGGKTGIGDPLSKAGVVEDSWGPITSTADTKPDPRDTFAKDPNANSEYKYGGAPYVVDNALKAKEAQEALHILPNMQKRQKHAAAAAKESEKKLEEDLGFKSSVLFSKTFDAALAKH